MWELNHQEGWAPKNWCFWNVVLEKTLESPLDCKRIQPANPKGNQCWIFTGRTDAEAEAPILWLSDSKNWLIGKHLNAGKNWRQQRKGTTEDEMVRWHHWLNGHDFEKTLGDSEGQASLAYCNLWGSQRVGHDLGTEQQQQQALSCSHLAAQTAYTLLCLVRGTTQAKWNPKYLALYLVHW